MKIKLLLIFFVEHICETDGSNGHGMNANLAVEHPFFGTGGVKEFVVNFEKTDGKLGIKTSEMFGVAGKLNPVISKIKWYIGILIFLFYFAVSLTRSSLPGSCLLFTSYMKMMPPSVATAKNLPSGEYLTVVGRFFSLSNY